MQWYLFDIDGMDHYHQSLDEILKIAKWRHTVPEAWLLTKERVRGRYHLPNLIKELRKETYIGWNYTKQVQESWDRSHRYFARLGEAMQKLGKRKQGIVTRDLAQQVNETLTYYQISAYVDFVWSCAETQHAMHEEPFWLALASTHGINLAKTLVASLDEAGVLVPAGRHKCTTYRIAHAESLAVIPELR